MMQALGLLAGSGSDAVGLSGAPDVVFLHSPSNQLYVAVGDPGVIDVIDVETMRREEVVTTEVGAHTLALDRKRNKVYAFLPQSHRACSISQNHVMGRKGTVRNFRCCRTSHQPCPPSPRPGPSGGMSAAGESRLCIVIASCARRV